MAQDKRVFTGGMDKDSEPRLIKNGDYRHAENIRNIASSDGTSGSVENIEGTKEVVHRFVNENNYIVETIEDGFISEPPLESIFFTQKIFIGGRELNGNKHQFSIWSYDEDSNLVYSGIALDWVGNSDGTSAATTLYNKFNSADGTISQNIPLIDRVSGETFTGHSEIYVQGTGLPFTPSTSMSLGNVVLVVEIVADVQGMDFDLDFKSSYSESPEFDLWVNTVNAGDPQGEFPIQVNGAIYLGSSGGIELSEGIAESVTDDGSPIGVIDAISDTDDYTEFIITLEGDNPITPEDPLNPLNIWSVVENYDGTMDAIPFGSDKLNFEGTFNTGDPFEFDGDQTEIAAAFVDKLTDFSTQILSPGATEASTHLISTANRNVVTGFNSTTKLAGVLNRNPIEADASDFYLLEAYTSENDFNSNIPRGFSVSSNTLTISGDQVIAGSSLSFPVFLFGGKTYKIEANVSAFSSSGNSIKFFDGKEYSEDISGVNNTFSYTFTPEVGRNNFSLEVSSDFAEEDSVTISGISISEYKQPDTELRILVRSAKHFDLVFGDDEETVKENFKQGILSRNIDFITGVSAKIEVNSQAPTAYDDLVIDYQESQQQIAELEATINALTLQLSQLTEEYNLTLENLNAANGLSSGDAVGYLNLLSADLSNLNQIIAQNQGASAAINLLTGDIAEQASEIANLTSQLSDLESEIEALEATLAEAEASNSSNIQDIQALLSQANSTINNINSQIANVIGEGQQVSDLISAYQDNQDQVTSLTTAIGGMITTLNTANLSDTSLQDDVNTQIASLEGAIQALVSINTTIDADTQSLQDLVDAVSSLQADYTGVLELVNDLTDVMTPLVPGDEGYAGGTSVIPNSNYASYGVNLQGIVDSFNTVIQDAYNLANAYEAEISTQAAYEAQLLQEAQDAAAAAEATLSDVQAELDAALAAEGVTQATLDTVQVDLAAAVADNVLLQSEADDIQAQLAVALANQEDGVTQADVDAAVALIQARLNSANATIADLEIQLAVALANQEDGITQDDLDAANESVDAAIQAQAAAEEALQAFENSMTLTNLVSNGTFDGNDSTGWTLSNSTSVSEEALQFSPGINAAITSSAVITTAGQYIISLSSSENFSNTTYNIFKDTDLSRPLYSDGIPIQSGFNLFDVVITEQNLDEVDQGLLFKLSTYLSDNQTQHIDNIQIFKVPDNVDITTTVYSEAIDLLNALTTQVASLGADIANAYTSDDINNAYLDGYNEGYAEGILQQDFTQGDIDAAFDDGVASVEQLYTETEVSNLEAAAELTGYNQGFIAGAASVIPEDGITQIDVDNIQALLDAANSDNAALSQTNTGLTTDVYSLLGLLNDLTLDITNFNASELNDVLADLNLIASTDDGTIADFTSDYVDNQSNLNDLINALSQQIQIIENTQSSGTNIYDEHSFVLYGDIPENYFAGISGGDVKILMKNSDIPGYETYQGSDPDHFIKIIDYGNDSASSLAGLFIQNCHLFSNGADDPHEGNADIPHAHYKIIDGGSSAETSLLKLEIKNFNSNSIFSSTDGQYLHHEDYSFVDENGEDLDRGLHFTVTVMSGNPNWEFILYKDGEGSIAFGDALNENYDGALEHRDILSFTGGGEIIYIESVDTINVLSGDTSDVLNPGEASGFTEGVESGAPGEMTASQTDWIYTTSTGKFEHDPDEGKVESGKFFYKTFTAEPNTIYEIRLRMWMHDGSTSAPNNRAFKVDLGDNTASYQNTVVEEPWTYNDIPLNAISDDGVFYRGAGINNTSGTGYRYVRITTGSNYSTTGIIRIQAGNGETDNDYYIFSGYISELSVKKVTSFEVSNEGISYGVNLLYEKTGSYEGNVVRNAAPSRAYTGSAKRILADFDTGNTTVVPIVSGGYKCIGSYEDKPKSKVYYFLINEATGKKFDCILEYDLTNDSISTVYQDDRASSDGSNNNILNFSDRNLITGVSKVDDILYWTDNLNRPRKINVELAKQNERNIENCKFLFKDAYYRSLASTVYVGTGSNNHPFKEGDDIYTQLNTVSGISTIGFNGYSKITGIVRKPNSGITFNVTLGSPVITASSPLHGLSSSYIGDFIGIQDSGNFPYYYQIESISGTSITLTTNYGEADNVAANPVQVGGANAVGVITDSPWPGTFSAVPGRLLYADPSSVYGEAKAHSPLISYGSYQEKSKYFDVVKHQPTFKPSVDFDVDSNVAANNILDNVFQFKYRYTHVDEEMTSYSPISDVVIDPHFALNAAVSAEDYTSIANRLDITYDDTISDVETIEIVARKGNDGEFFLVDTLQNNFIKHLKKLKNELIGDSDYEYTDTESNVAFYNNGTYPFVDKLDSDKLYDAVPKKAKAQTILSNNRLAYGNILEGYDNTKMVIQSEFKNDGGVSLESNQVDVPYNGSSFGESEFILGSGGGNSTYRPQLDLNGLNLGPNNSQYINIDLGFQAFYTQPFGGSFKRGGSISASYTVTGFVDVDLLCNEVANRINNESFIGGANTNHGPHTNKNVSAEAIGGGIITIQFKCTPSGSGISTGTLLSFISPNNSSFISGDVGLSAFKTGAFHNFGVAYFDETNRCSFVNSAPDYGVNLDGVNLNGTRPYNKFYTEDGGSDLGSTSSLKFKIYNEPPSWATHYQMYYTGNTTVDEFIQMTVVNAKISSDANDKQIYLSLQSLKGEEWSYNQANNSQIGYNYVAGDRIRFISFDPGSGRRKFTEYIDLEIAGEDLYVSEDGEPISTDSTTQGYYLRINDPENAAVSYGDAGESISIAHSGFSYGSSGYENLIAEIYRPKKNLDEDLMVYYEVGKKYPIINGRHIGDSSQAGGFVLNKDLNTRVSTIPAEVLLTQGDVYFKPRNMATNETGSTSELFFPEDYYLNDFHRTNHYSKGRVNVINNNASERRLEASVYYSETYSSTASINGLSSFNLANTPYYDYNKNFGSIQSLMMRDDDLLIFHENKVGRVLVQKDILTTASGEGLVSLSNRVIDNYVSLYSGEYGCCLQPESIVKFGNKFYFIDIKRGVALRLSNDGLTVTSDQGMRDYFRDLGEMYVINNPEGQKEYSFSIVAGYDPKYDEYIVTFPDVYQSRDSWGGDKTNWDSSYDRYRNKTPKILYEGKTIAFNERTNRWTSFYDFYPEYYARVGRQFIGFKDGKLYKHNMTDRGYQNLYTGPESWQNKYNHFYDDQYDSTIQFPFNIEPSSVKSYNAISLESDSKFFTSMYTNIGQTVEGPNSFEDGYSTTISTEIGYRKVNGLINNYSSSIGDETLISGTDTKFFEDVKKGDIVKVWGMTPTGAYKFHTRLVAQVISNEILRLSSNIRLSIKDSYMEVIDYKTKEGVQYAHIPFVESNPEEDLRLSYTDDHGDGSEFFGIGIGTEVISSGSIATFSPTSTSFNTVLIQKTIAPKDMIVGAEYVVFQTETPGIPGTFSIETEAAVGYEGGTEVGSVFKCRKKATSNSGRVLSTDYKLYLQKQDGETVFLGYPYISEGGNMSYIKSSTYGGPSVAYTDVFLFIVKDGNVEGERMKGQYMMTTLTTNHPGDAYASKYKFNLYAANADIDKSELSNK